MLAGKRKRERECEREQEAAYITHVSLTYKLCKEL